MFKNHTEIYLFDIFEKKYEEKLYLQYDHLRKFPVHCYTLEQYNIISGESLDDYKNDSFAFIVDCSKGSRFCDTFAVILISPDLCEALSFTPEEYMAAIAHEVGHIIHFFNESLVGASDIVIEIKADSIVKELGLSIHLRSVLEKLKRSNLYTEVQCKMMDFRMFLLND